MLTVDVHLPPAEPKCERCDHITNWHDIEPPYPCNDPDCDCKSYRPPAAPAESEGKPCNGCGTPEGQPHGVVCPVRPMPGDTDWVEIAKAHVAEHGTVSAEDIRKINEPYKDAILRAMDHPTAPPDESVEDAKAFIQKSGGWCYRLTNGGPPLSEFMAEFAERYATKQIERQTPAIIEVLRRTIARYDDINNGTCAVCRIGHRLYDLKGNLGICEWKDCLSHEWRDAMQTVKPAVP